MNHKNLLIILSLFFMSIGASCTNSKPMPSTADSMPQRTASEPSASSNTAGAKVHTESVNSANNMPQKKEMNIINLNNLGTIQYEDTHFDISIRENPTTGYTWQWSEAGISPENNETTHFKLIKDEYKSDIKRSPQGKPLAGAGGTHYFSFTVQNIADENIPMELTLIYYRKWEIPTEFDKKAVLSVQANSEGKILLIEAK